MADEDEVRRFLMQIKPFVIAKELYFVPRNLSDIAALGITFEQAEAEILALQPIDYCEGPNDDHDGSPGQVWIFGKDIDGKLVYIKLKLNGDDARCLSFHAAARPLRFPLR